MPLHSGCIYNYQSFHLGQNNIMLIYLIKVTKNEDIIIINFHYYALCNTLDCI